MADQASGIQIAQAPGQYLGYSMQAVVFLLELINGDEGSTISLEYFGDVGVANDVGSTSIEVKSGLETNPISDRAVGLWKTFANWINAVISNQLTLTTTIFVLHV